MLVLSVSLPGCNEILLPLLSRSHSRAMWNAEIEVGSCLSSVTIFDFFFLRQGLSWARSPWNRLGWLPANWRNHFVSAWLLHLSAGESTSGSHACAVSTFLNESPPQSLSQILGVLCIAESNLQELSPVKETTEHPGDAGECCSIRAWALGGNSEELCSLSTFGVSIGNQYVRWISLHAPRTQC